MFRVPDFRFNHTSVRKMYMTIKTTPPRHGHHAREYLQESEIEVLVNMKLSQTYFPSMLQAIAYYLTRHVATASHNPLTLCFLPF